MKDIIIIGAGPAGVSAALYASAAGTDCLILERDRVGGSIAKASIVDKYVGLTPGEDGESFRKKMERQLEDSGAELRIEEVVSVDWDNKIVKTNQGEYRSKAVIIATGSRPKELNIEQEGLIKYRSLPYIDLVKGKTVFVAGSNDDAAEEILFLADHAEQVFVVEEKDEVQADERKEKKMRGRDNIEILTGSMIESVEDDHGLIKTVSVYNREEDEHYRFRCDEIHLFSFNTVVPNNKLIPFKMLDEKGWLKGTIDTEIDGVYACGDLFDKPVKHISTAVADGTIAAVSAVKYVKSL